MRPPLPGTTGTPAFSAAMRAATLSPMVRMASPLGPDEDHPGLVDGFGEARILGQEAVARMDGIGARLPRRLDDSREY